MSNHGLKKSGKNLALFEVSGKVLLFFGGILVNSLGNFPLFYALLRYFTLHYAILSYFILIFDSMISYSIQAY